MIEFHRMMEGDITPVMVCSVCHEPLPLSAAWFAFEPIPFGGQPTPGQVLHRTCLNGNMRTRFGASQIELGRIEEGSMSHSVEEESAQGAAVAAAIGQIVGILQQLADDHGFRAAQTAAEKSLAAVKSGFVASGKSLL